MVRPANLGRRRDRAGLGRLASRGLGSGGPIFRGEPHLAAAYMAGPTRAVVPSVRGRDRPHRSRIQSGVERHPSSADGGHNCPPRRWHAIRLHLCPHKICEGTRLRVLVLPLFERNPRPSSASSEDVLCGLPAVGRSIFLDCPCPADRRGFGSPRRIKFRSCSRRLDGPRPHVRPKEL